MTRRSIPAGLCGQFPNPNPVYEATARQEVIEHRLFNERKTTMGDAIRGALIQIREVCFDNEDEACNHRLALSFVASVANAALAQPVAPLRGRQALDELSPCPFCGSAQVEYIGATVKGYRVECNGCLAQSGCGDYGYQAKQNWNTRAAPQQLLEHRLFNERKTTMADAMRDALERSVIAIDDWLQTYASELCDPVRVEEASKRIGEYGTLSYIAIVQEQNRAALAATPAVDLEDAVHDIMLKYIELDYLHASDGHPEIVGFGKAAAAIVRALSAAPPEQPASSTAYDVDEVHHDLLRRLRECDAQDKQLLDGETKS